MDQNSERKYFIKPSVFVWISVVLMLSAIYFYSDKEIDFTKSNPNITEIHYVDGITPAHLKVINLFNEKYEGRIKVIPIDLPFEKFSTNERKELLARSLRSKSEKVDIFSVDIVWGYRFAKWAENLTPYFTKDYLDKIVEPILPSCYFKDSLFAIPFTLDMGTMFYRDDLIQDLPDYETIKTKLANSITWEDFIELGLRLKDNGHPYYVFPASDYEGLICSFAELILNQNRDFFKSDSIDLTRTEAVRALTTLDDLIGKYGLTPKVVTAFTEYPCHVYFIQKNAMFVRSWPTFFSGSYQLVNEDKIIPVPLPHYRDTKPAAIFGGWNLVISKFSENKHEALEFLKFLIEPEIQKIMFESNGALPVLKSVYDDSAMVDVDVLKFYKNQFEYGVHRPLLEDYTRISDITSYFVHKVLVNEMGLNEALKQATRMINSKEVIFK